MKRNQGPTHGWPQHAALAVAALLVAAGFAAGQTPNPAPRLLDLAGQPVDPFHSTSARAVVFLFTRTDCPISNGYAPEVRRIHQEFAPEGVAFWLVYVDPDEPADAIRKHIHDYAYPADPLRDPQHSLVKIAGVRVTPEAAVFARQGPRWRIVYRGRIDNRFVDLGKMRPEPTTRDLEQVLKAIVERRPVTSRTTRAVGCLISDLK